MGVWAYGDLDTALSCEKWTHCRPLAAGPSGGDLGSSGGDLGSYGGDQGSSSGITTHREVIEAH